MTILVVGAGVAGLTVAVELAERGIPVEVIDRASELGRDACSWYAGGMLAPWCEGETAEAPVVRFGAEALDWWDAHVPNVTRLGSLVIAAARDQGELKRFSRRTENYQWVDGKAVADLEPDLAGQHSRGLYFADEAHLDPRAALAALIEKLKVRGIGIQYGVSLENLTVGNRTIIDARGFAASDSLPDLRGVKGEMLVVRTREVDLSRPLRLTHPRFPVYMVPRGDGVYMIGATQIESEDRSRITARGMVDLLNAAYAVHPAFAEAELLETGCDIRPAFPDNLPRIRRYTNRITVNGLFRHGFLLAPACARMVADLVENPDSKPEFMDEDHRERQSA